MNLLKTIRFILNHPLNCDHKLSAINRFFRWQISSRIFKSPVIINFAGNSKLIVKKGLTHASGNLYCGLYEYEDMAFVLHFLRKEDLFIDVGANIGAFTILSSAAASARCIAIEPVSTTFADLLENIYLNNVTEHVIALNNGVSNQPGKLLFSSNLGATNHVILEEGPNKNTQTIDVITLDSICENEFPALIKIDVEGFETRVLEGAGKVLDSDNLKALIIELNGNGNHYGFDEDKLHQLILEKGFNTYLYNPKTRNLEKKENRNLQGNTLYIRNLEFVSARLANSEKFKVLQEMV